MVIGLTGGIASGKSTVAQMLQNCGAVLIDADALAREVVEQGEPANQEIRMTFGDGVFTENGDLDRGALGAIVFNSPTKRQQLEQIIHPHVRRRIREQIEYTQQKEVGRPIVVDIPLLYESKLDKVFDFEEIIVVYVPRDIQLNRLIARQKLTHEEAIKRIEIQMDLDAKMKLADVVIDNSGDFVDTQKQVATYVKSRRWA